MAPLRRGDFVSFDNLLAVVVGVEGDPDVPEDHVALWFGEPADERASHGGSHGLRPVMRTVPVGYCSAALEPEIRH